jgi:lambda family phage minor tail protein L
MGIRADIQSLSPSALIELFELDMSVTTSGGKLYFHAGTNGLSQPIVWQGVSYEPWPIKASGFDKAVREHFLVKDSGFQLRRCNFCRAAGQ